MPGFFTRNRPDRVGPRENQEGRRLPRPEARRAQRHPRNPQNRVPPALSLAGHLKATPSGQEPAAEVERDIQFLPLERVEEERCIAGADLLGIDVAEMIDPFLERRPTRYRPPSGNGNRTTRSPHSRSGRGRRPRPERAPRHSVSSPGFLGVFDVSSTFFFVLVLVLPLPPRPHRPWPGGWRRPAPETGPEPAPSRRGTASRPTGILRVVRHYRRRYRRQYEWPRTADDTPGQQSG